MPRIKGEGGKVVEKIGPGRWRVRVSYINPATGKRVDVRRFVRTEASAKKLLGDIIKDVNENEGNSVAHDRKTFSDLSDEYLERYACDAVYHGDRKIKGLRSARTVRQQVGMLRDHFGKTRLRAISKIMLEDLRAQRLRTPVGSAPCRTCKEREADRSKCKDCGGTGRKRRSIATCNREMALLRRMLNVAVNLSWLTKSPFSRAEKMVTIADEKQRERILSIDEERRLLAAAQGTAARDTLRAIIICALDTGMRQGEILKLVWSDLDFTTGSIVVQSFNTKTATTRSVHMTPRLTRELMRLRKLAGGGDPERLVFGIADNCKRSFTAVRREAGLTDVRFHDLRHTCAVRLVSGQLPLAQVGRVLGHTQPKTTYRYINSTPEMLDQAAAILAKWGETAD